MALSQQEKAKLCCAMFTKEDIGEAYFRKIFIKNESKMKWEVHADMDSTPAPS